MAKDSDRRRGGFDVEETGGALSGLLAEEDEFDRRTLWRLGTWAAVSVGAVVLALVTNQSSIGLRREQTASADLMKQAQQLQLAARDSQSEARRLASAVDTLNSDRDRLYSRVAVLEQGLDSVTGAIAHQAVAPSPPQTSAGPANSAPASASAAPPASSSTQPPASAPAQTQPLAPVASTAPAPAASVDPSPTTARPAPATSVAAVAPAVAPVAATAPAIPDKAADKAAPDKKDKQASAAPPSEPSAAAKSASSQQTASAQASGSLMAAKSMMSPPDAAAGKLVEPATPPKTVIAEPLPEIAAVAPNETHEEAEADSAPPELVARRTEFGVDVGGANSVPGLRALWRGLLKSRSNTALTTLRPIIVIKENNNGLGMQLRLVAGPINDAAAAAKICASLTVSDRGCTTTVFEGQRLSIGAEEQPKMETRAGSESKASSEAKPVSEAKADSDGKPAASNQKFSGHHRYVSRRASKQQEDSPKPEPSTLSRLFSSH
jgi:hypothetical protein